MRDDIIYTYNANGVQALANQVKEVFAETLLKDGVIDAAAYKKMTEKYVMVVIRKGWLGKIIDKLLPFEKGDETLIKVLKIPDEDTQANNVNG